MATRSYISTMKYCRDPWKIDCPNRECPGCVYPNQFGDGRITLQDKADENPKFGVTNVCNEDKNKCPGNLQFISYK